MVAHILQVVTEYKERLRRMPYVPRFSYGRGMLRDDGAPNRFFINYLCCDQAMAIQFMKEVGWLQSKVQCKIVLWPFFLSLTLLILSLYEFQFFRLRHLVHAAE